MSVRDRMYELVTPEEVDEFLAKFPNGAIFKAGGCHKTMEGFANVEQALEGRPDLSVGFIRVIESRPASNHIAALTEIVHQSPQFVLFVDGKAIFDVDNWDITLEAMEENLARILGPSEVVEAVSSPASDLSHYQSLLEKYVCGDLGEPDFEQKWLTAFQQDVTPRNSNELTLLSSLFGDVDAALVGIGSQRPGLKDRAEQLLQAIR